MIDVAITEAEGIASTIDILEATADYKDIPPELPPWTYGTELETIEEIEVDLPSSFPWQLHYMEMPYEAALQEYFSLFEEHIFQSSVLRQMSSTCFELRVQGS